MPTLADLALPPPPARLLRWLSAVDEPSPTSNAPLVDDDLRCMARVGCGDPDALQPIFDRWKLPLMSFFYRSLGCHADAEDLTLQTFHRVYRAAARYRPEAKFSTWLFSIARRELLHELRRRRRKPVEAAPPEMLACVAANASDADRRRAAELEELLLSALRQLPERQSSALLLVAAGEHSQSEIAATLGVSGSHLNVILHRARQTLRALFNRHP